MATRDSRDAHWEHRDTVSSERPTNGDPFQSTWSLGRSPAFARWADEIRAQARDLIQQRDASARSHFASGAAPRPGDTTDTTNETTALRDFLPFAVEGQGPSAWTFERLFASCSLKGILCDFSSDAAAPRSVLVRRGSLSLIRLRADLAPDERIAALAHALGHIYYQHTPRVCDVGIPEVGGSRTRREEREADRWAAHCLVWPEVYDAMVALDHHSQDVAVERTARRLAIPPWVVETWLSARDIRYAEMPREWLSHP